MPKFSQAGRFGEPSYLVYSECVHLLVIFQPSAFEHPERVAKPELYGLLQENMMRHL